MKGRRKMTKEQWLALGLSKEQAGKAAAVSQEELRSYIPKARFDQVNESRKRLEQELKEQALQLKVLSEKLKEQEALTLELAELKKAYQKAQDRYQADLQQLRLGMALKLALEKKVHDVDLVGSLLDQSRIEIDARGNIRSGLDEQLAALKVSKAFLFREEEPRFQFMGIKPLAVAD
jgi:predicted nuclease with TOPRIM domain